MTGQVATTPRERHGLLALEDSAVLLTAVTEIPAGARPAALAGGGPERARDPAGPTGATPEF